MGKPYVSASVGMRGSDDDDVNQPELKFSTQSNIILGVKIQKVDRLQFFPTNFQTISNLGHHVQTTTKSYHTCYTMWYQNTCIVD